MLPGRSWALTALPALALLLATACNSPSSNSAHDAPDVNRTPRPAQSHSSEGKGPVRPDALILASGFEQPVCGFWQHPRAGCEFGVEGDAEAGPFDPRTGNSALRLQRLRSDTHVGVVANLPLPNGHAYVGLGHRIPAFPRGAISPERGYLQLEQLSPTDGTVPSWPVEVRLYADRRLGLALFGDGPDHRSPFVVADWEAPVNRWFYVVVRLINGNPATQRMWVYEEGRDEPVADVKISLFTRVEWSHSFRTAQKVGGTVPTHVPMFTYHDDFYVATRNLGPLQIGSDGLPLEAPSS